MAADRHALELVFDGPDPTAAMQRTSSVIDTPGAIIPIRHKQLSHGGSSWRGSIVVIPDEAALVISLAWITEGASGFSQ